MNSDTFPSAIVVPSHQDNYYRPENHGGVANKPRGLFLHTPEEKADATEVTPYYFSRRIYGPDGVQRIASTHYYASGGQGTLGDGQLYQCVPEDCAAVANGLDGKPRPAWADPNTSLNWQSLSIEIEGYAASMRETCPRGSKQWNTVVTWVVVLAKKYGIPIDRQHVMGHYEVSVQRTDPGTLDLDQIVRDAQAFAGGHLQELLEDATMPVPWVRDNKTGNSFVIVARKRVPVNGAEQEAALLKSGYIKRPEVMMTTKELDTIPLAE